MEHVIHLLKRGPSLKHMVVLTFLMGGVFPFSLRNKRPDPDLWWHLRAGQYIVETRSIPQQDIFSFTSAGRPFVDHEWICQILFHIAHHRWGFDGLVICSGIFATITCLLLLMLLYRLTGQLIISLAGSAFIMWGMRMFFVPRPQVFTYLFFSLLLLLLVSARMDKSAIKVLWAAPLMMVLWANCHGGFLMGIVLLGVYWLAEEWEAATTSPILAPDYLKILRLIVPICLLVWLINPYGYRLILTLLPHLSTPLLQSTVVEWKPPNLLDPHYTPPLIAGLLLLIGGLGFASQKGYRGDVWLALVVTYMALSSRRHIPLFLISLAPVLACSLNHLFHATVKEITNFPVAALSLRRIFSYRPLLHVSQTLKEFIQDRSAIYWIPLVIVFMATLSHAASLKTPTSVEEYPVRAANFLASRRLYGNMFNSYGWGGYLIYRLWPHYRVFIDGRFPLVHSESTFRDYLTISRMESGWEQLIERYDICLLFFSSNQNARLVEKVKQSKDWRQIYQDDIAVIFQRVGEPTSPS